MKREASTSLEKLESLNQEDISHKQVEDLRCFITSNRARDYFLLKARMSNEAFTNALRSLFFDGTAGEPQVKTDNPFYQAMYSVAGSACSYGVNHSYAFQMMDHSDGSTQPEATALEPFVFTLVQLPNNQFRVMINRVDDQLEIAVGNLLDIYRTDDIRTINSSRIISDIEMQHGIAADHSIYQDILSTIENTVSLQCAHAVLCKVSYDALCQALGVARTSFVKFILDFLQRLNIKPHDFIEKDGFLLLRTIIIGGSFNEFYHPVEPTQKLELLFSHIGTRPYMQSNFITEFFHPYINKALEKSNIEAVTFLLAKVTNADKRKILFEKSNYELFFTAYKYRNISMMAMLVSLLPENLQQKFFALIYLLTYIEIQLQAACWAATRDKLLKWVEELLEKTNDEEIKVGSRELQEIMLDRKEKYTKQDLTSYQYSDREYELHPPVYTNSEDNYDQTLQPLPVTQEQQDEMNRWINEVLPEVLNRFQDYTVEQWKSNILDLFIFQKLLLNIQKPIIFLLNICPSPTCSIRNCC